MSAIGPGLGKYLVLLCLFLLFSVVTATTQIYNFVETVSNTGRNLQSVDPTAVGVSMVLNYALCTGTTPTCAIGLTVQSSGATPSWSSFPTGSVVQNSANILCLNMYSPGLFSPYAPISCPQVVSEVGTGVTYSMFVFLAAGSTLTWSASVVEYLSSAGIQINLNSISGIPVASTTSYSGALPIATPPFFPILATIDGSIRPVAVFTNVSNAMGPLLVNEFIYPYNNSFNFTVFNSTGVNVMSCMPSLVTHPNIAGSSYTRDNTYPQGQNVVFAELQQCTGTPLCAIDPDGTSLITSVPLSVGSDGLGLTRIKINYEFDPVGIPVRTASVFKIIACIGLLNEAQTGCNSPSALLFVDTLNTAIAETNEYYFDSSFITQSNTPFIANEISFVTYLRVAAAVPVQCVNNFAIGIMDITVEGIYDRVAINNWPIFNTANTSFLQVGTNPLSPFETFVDGGQVDIGNVINPVTTLISNVLPIPVQVNGQTVAVNFTFPINTTLPVNVVNTPNVNVTNNNRIPVLAQQDEGTWYINVNEFTAAQQVQVTTSHIWAPNTDSNLAVSVMNTPSVVVTGQQVSLNITGNTTIPVKMVNGFYYTPSAGGEPSLFMYPWDLSALPVTVYDYVKQKSDDTWNYFKKWRHT